MYNVYSVPGAVLSDKGGWAVDPSLEVSRPRPLPTRLSRRPRFLLVRGELGLIRSGGVVSSWLISREKEGGGRGAAREQITHDVIQPFSPCSVFPWPLQCATRSANQKNSGLSALLLLRPAG